MDLMATLLLATIVVAGIVTTAIVLTRRPTTPPPGGLGDMHEGIGRLHELMSQVMTGHQSMQGTISALVHNPGKRGSWGELTLLRLLEGAGMMEGTDFDVQKNLADGSRPDVIIHLGDAGEIVIDSKMPLSDLQGVWDSEDEAARAAGFRAFADNVRSMAKKLAGRNYAGELKTTFAPVVMYIPVDGAWQAARQARPDLLSELLGMSIYPAEPSTMGMLIELLRHQAMTITQEAGVKAVIEDARTLIERLRVHVDHLGTVGKGLDKATKAYNEAVGSYVSRVQPAAGRIAAHTGVRLDTPGMALTAADTDRADRLGAAADAA